MTQTLIHVHIWLSHKYQNCKQRSVRKFPARCRSVKDERSSRKSTMRATNVSSAAVFLLMHTFPWRRAQTFPAGSYHKFPFLRWTSFLRDVGRAAFFRRRPPRTNFSVHLCGRRRPSFENRRGHRASGAVTNPDSWFYVAFVVMILELQVHIYFPLNDLHYFAVNKTKRMNVIKVMKAMVGSNPCNMAPQWLLVSLILLVVVLCEVTPEVYISGVIKQICYFLENLGFRQNTSTRCLWFFNHCVMKR